MKPTREQIIAASKSRKERKEQRIRDAAPELLEALNAMLEAYAPRHATTFEQEGESALHGSVVKARRAIIKATGEFASSPSFSVAVQNDIHKELLEFAQFVDCWLIAPNLDRTTLDFLQRKARAAIAKATGA